MEQFLLFYLEKIADKSGKNLEVYIDGGFRNGIDILKAKALGAKAVFVGDLTYMV